MVLPKWADHIEVDQTDRELIVRGSGRCFQPVPRGAAEGFFEDFLGDFDDGRKMTRPSSGQAAHLLFAGAQSIDKQVDFVKRFGPVAASDVDYGLEPDTSIARQDREALRIEQQLFARVFDLNRLLSDLRGWSKGAFEAQGKYITSVPPISLKDEEDEWPQGTYTVSRVDSAKHLDSFLRREGFLNSNEDEQISKIREYVFAIQRLIEFYPEAMLWKHHPPFSWKNVFTPYHTMEEMEGLSSIEIFDLGNDFLCRIFNLFPLTLHYSRGTCVQMPKMRPSGVRDALYYMIRMEYLYQREIRLCAVPNCGHYFVPDRADTEYCSDACSNRAKQRRLGERKRRQKN